jgi:hypothetical protein
MCPEVDRSTTNETEATILSHIGSCDTVRASIAESVCIRKQTASWHKQRADESVKGGSFGRGSLPVQRWEHVCQCNTHTNNEHKAGMRAQRLEATWQYKNTSNCGSDSYKEIEHLAGERRQTPDRTERLARD